MTEREQYLPGPASGAHIRRDGEKWTLILVRELRHPPEKVWHAITDPAHLREWAPFDANGNLDMPGATVKLTTVGVPGPRITETTVKRADAPNLLEYTWGDFDMRWELEALGRRHAPEAVDQYRPPLHRHGCSWVAHLFRCAGSLAQWNSHRTHRRPQGHELRRLAALERRVHQAVRRASARLVAQGRSGVVNRRVDRKTNSGPVWSWFWNECESVTHSVSSNSHTVLSPHARTSRMGEPGQIRSRR